MLKGNCTPVKGNFVVLLLSQSLALSVIQERSSFQLLCSLLQYCVGQITQASKLTGVKVPKGDSTTNLLWSL